MAVLEQHGLVRLGLHRILDGGWPTGGSLGRGDTLELLGESLQNLGQALEGELVWGQLLLLQIEKSGSDAEFAKAPVEMDRLLVVLRSGCWQLGLDELPAVRKHGLCCFRLVQGLWAGQRLQIRLRHQLGKPIGTLAGRELGRPNGRAGEWKEVGCLLETHVGKSLGKLLP